MIGKHSLSCHWISKINMAQGSGATGLGDTINGFIACTAPSADYIGPGVRQTNGDGLTNAGICPRYKRPSAV